jgi:hypothetical protein
MAWRGLLLSGCFSLVMAAAAGCGTGGLQRVAVCGDVRVPEDIDLIRIVLRDDRLVEKTSGTIELGEAGLTLPIEVKVKAYAGRGYLSVQGVHLGLEVVRFDRLYATLDRLDPVQAALTQSCLGITTCPLGQTCVDGRCVVAPDETSTVSCTGMAPMGSDAGDGTADAGGGM